MGNKCDDNGGSLACAMFTLRDGCPRTPAVLHPWRQTGSRRWWQCFIEDDGAGCHGWMFISVIWRVRQNGRSSQRVALNWMLSVFFTHEKNLVPFYSCVIFLILSIHPSFHPSIFWLSVCLKTLVCVLLFVCRTSDVLKLSILHHWMCFYQKMRTTLTSQWLQLSHANRALWTSTSTTPVLATVSNFKSMKTNNINENQWKLKWENKTKVAFIPVRKMLHALQ